MRRIISILLVVFMLASTMTAFATQTTEIALSMNDGAELQVSNSGTVAFGAIIPEDYTTSLYINGIATTFEETEGNVVATLPDGVAFGDATVKLTATKEAETVETSKAVKLVKEWTATEKEVPFSATSPYGFDSSQSVTATPTANADALGGYELAFPSGGSRAKVNLGKAYGAEGIWEISFDIKANSDNVDLDQAFASGTDITTGIIFKDVPDNNGDKNLSGRHALIKGRYIGGDEKGIRIQEGDRNWHHIATRLDIKNKTFAFYFDGKVARAGELDTTTYNSFKWYNFRYIRNCSIKNLKFSQVYSTPEISQATAVYADGSEVDATDEAVNGFNLNGFKFTATEAITLGAKGAKLVNSKGETVSENVTINGKEITVTGSLPDDEYKLVIGNDAQVGTTVLGAEVRKTVTVTSQAELLIPEEELQVSDSGVTFGAIIPQGYTKEIYINGILAAGTTFTPGENEYNYNVVAPLPDGVAFGNATVKLTATKDGKTVESSKAVKLVKNWTAVKKEVPFSNTGNFGFYYVDAPSVVTPTANADALGGYELYFGSGTRANVSLGGTYGEEGIWEMSFDIKTTSDSTVVDEVFSTSSSSSSNNGFNFVGLSNADSSAVSTNGRHSIIKGRKIGNSTTYVPKDGQWHHIASRVDIKNKTFAFYLDGEVAQTGALNTATYNNFTHYCLRYIRYGSIKNLKFSQVYSTPEISGATAVYADGSEVDATDGTVSSFDLDRIAFTTTEAITLGAKGAKLVNSKGETVPATVTVDGNEITATYTQAGILPSGEYQLVIANDAKVGTTVLGAEVSKTVTFSAEDSILSPAVDEKVADKVTLSAYAGGAQKVEFYINNALVKEFAPTQDGIYEFDYALTENGVKQFDVYIYGETDVKLLTRTFVANTNHEFNTTNLSVNNANAANETNIFSGNEYHKTGRICIEGDVTPSTNTDRYYFEAGAGKEGNFSSSSTNYVTIADLPGYGDAIGLFHSNGKLYKSEIPYQAGVTYRVKLVLDTDKDQYEYYVDGNLIAIKQSTAGSSGKNLADITNIFRYFRFRSASGVTGGTKPTAGLKNFRIYEEAELPTVTGITYGATDAKTVGGYVIPETATTVTLALDKAYTTLTDADVAVTLDGVEVTPGVAYDGEAKTVTLSNLALTAGKKLVVTMKETAKVTVTSNPTSGTMTTAAIDAGRQVVTEIAVADKDGLALTSLQKTSVGGQYLAIVKYMNTGAQKEAKMILANYGSADGVPTLTKAEIAELTMAADTVAGLASASMEVEIDKAFLWDMTTLKPLIDAQ